MGRHRRLSKSFMKIQVLFAAADPAAPAARMPSIWRDTALAVRNRAGEAADRRERGRGNRRRRRDMAERFDVRPGRSKVAPRGARFARVNRTPGRVPVIERGVLHKVVREREADDERVQWRSALPDQPTSEDDIDDFKRTVLAKLTLAVGKDASSADGPRLVCRDRAVAARPGHPSLARGRSRQSRARPQARLLPLARIPDRPACCNDVAEQPAD